MPRSFWIPRSAIFEPIELSVNHDNRMSPSCVGLVHTVRGTAGNVADVVEVNSLLHGQEMQALGDAGYQDADQRPDGKPNVVWHVAMRPDKRKKLDKTQPLGQRMEMFEKTKASIRAKVEHPFRVIRPSVSLNT